MASNQKKLKEAKKQLAKANNASKSQSKQTDIDLASIKQRFKHIKNVLGNESKKEYENIDDEHIPLTLASEYIPLQDIERGIIKTTDGRFLKILQISPVNYNLKADAEKENIIFEFQKYLKIAPSKFQIKCISKQSLIRNFLRKIDMDKAREKVDSALDFYDDQINFISDIATREAISRTYYMIIEYQPESRILANNFDAAKRQLDDAEATAKRFLGNCGNKVYDFSESPTMAQAEILYTILNRELSTEIPFDIHMEDFEDRWLSASPKNTDVSKIKLREYISPQEIDFMNNKYVIVDGIYMSAIAISSNGYLTDVPDTWISRFTTLGEGIDVDIFVTKENRQAMSNKLYQTRKFNKLRLNDANNSGSDSDKIDTIMDSIQSSTYIREGLKNGQDFYWVNTLIYVTARNKEAWEYKVKEVKKYLKVCDFKYNSLSNLQEDAFYSYMPFCNLAKDIYRVSKQNMLTDGLTSFYPFTSYEMTEEDGILFGTSEENNSLVTINPFNTKKYSNANIVILGTSGAGKTYLLSTMIGRQRAKHIPTIVLAPDKAFEFARLCDKWKGEFISIGPASDKNINIMEIRVTDNESSKYIDGNVMENSLLVEKIQSLLIWFSIMIPDMSYEEKELLDDVLMNTYRDFKIFQDNESLYLKDENGNKIMDEETGRYKLKKMPILGDVFERLEKIPACKRMAIILRRFVHGSAKNFNQQTNANLDNELVVIDVSNLSGDMLLLGMFIALDFAIAKVKEDRTVMRSIAIDEMSILIGASSNSLAANHVLNLYKTIRGYGSNVIGATQNLSDFQALENGKYGKGIINNAEIKMVLKTKPDEIEDIQKSLGLTDEEAEKLPTLKHQAMLIANNNNMVINIKASQLEHRLITTDRSDLAKIKEENMQRNI